MKPRLEVVALDSYMLRLFDAIDEANIPWLLATAQRLRAVFGDELLELVPSYTTLMLRFDPLRLEPLAIRERLFAALDGLQPLAGENSREQVLPVWYDPSVGPDLARLARHTGLGVAEVIRRHSGRAYQVFALGFAPGFAFMGLVEPALATPRLATPRQRVAAGSVGIAERQTAAYPLASPGGWNLLGRTPARLFDRGRDGYSLLQPGDRVRFEAIDRAEFIRLGGDDTPMPAEEAQA